MTGLGYVVLLLNVFLALHANASTSDHQKPGEVGGDVDKPEEHDFEEHDFPLDPHAPHAGNEEMVRIRDELIDDNKAALEKTVEEEHKTYAALKSWQDARKDALEKTKELQRQARILLDRILLAHHTMYEESQLEADVRIEELKKRARGMLDRFETAGKQNPNVLAVRAAIEDRERREALVRDSESDHGHDHGHTTPVTEDLDASDEESLGGHHEVPREDHKPTEVVTEHAVTKPTDTVHNEEHKPTEVVTEHPVTEPTVTVHSEDRKPTEVATEDRKPTEVATEHHPEDHGTQVPVTTQSNPTEVASDTQTNHSIARS